MDNQIMGENSQSITRLLYILERKFLIESFQKLSLINRSFNALAKNTLPYLEIIADICPRKRVGHSSRAYNSRNKACTVQEKELSQRI